MRSVLFALVLLACSGPDGWELRTFWSQVYASDVPHQQVSDPYASDCELVSEEIHGIGEFPAEPWIKRTYICPAGLT